MKRTRVMTQNGDLVLTRVLRHYGEYTSIPPAMECEIIAAVTKMHVR